MIKNYITTALRNLLKNRLYALINVVGLAIGLAIYVFGTVLVDYERGHDQNFDNYDDIYMISSVFSPSASPGVSKVHSVYSAFGPYIRSGIQNVEYVARIRRAEFLVNIGETGFYQDIRFTDPDFTRIFDLTYISGDATALDSPDGLIVTQSVAVRMFGNDDPVGRVVTLDRGQEAVVRAVVEDLPANTHFNSSVLGAPSFQVLASLELLRTAGGFDASADWRNLSMGQRTYVLMPDGRDADWFEQQINMLYEAHFPEDQKEIVSRLELDHVGEANTYLFESAGLPVLTSISILAVLVLVVACVNYTNLAIAQSLGRAREVGLRRTLGADRKQLLVQFLTESLVTATFAMIIAVVLLELLIPVFNQMLGKVLALNLGESLPWLFGTVVVIGLLSGGYPAHLIARTEPIEALRDGGSKGRSSSFLRSAMISVQFVIAVFMLSTVAVMYFQNQRVKDTINLFPTDQVVALERMNREGIEPSAETLRQQLKQLPGVINVTYTNQVPFDQSNRTFDVSLSPGDESTSISMNRIRMDQEFLSVFDIPLLAGRDLSLEIATDFTDPTSDRANVIVNELAVSRLGISSPEAAIGQSFYSDMGEEGTRQNTIVGVVASQNFLGLHNQVKPFVFFAAPNRYYGAVRIRPGNVEQTLQEIEQVWDQVYPSYPMQSKFLSEQFEMVYGIFRAINIALSGFAFVALSLALIGLFGLAAFMAERRTREIGIRRVLGASVPQLVRLLIWQFSKPVVWALVVALPLSYFAAGLYLNVFADRIDLPAGIILGAGLASILLAWAIVATHASWVARANPVNALRYE